MTHHWMRQVSLSSSRAPPGIQEHKTGRPEAFQKGTQARKPGEVSGQDLT